MSETYRCGDGSALVAYLYHEGDAAGRKAMAAHLAACQACTDELDALAGARASLAGWSPPEVRLGFRMTSDAGVDGVAASAGRGPSREVRRWWQDPLPAWAQMAAAILIFGVGVAVGGRERTPETAPASDPSVAALRATVSTLEQRIVGVERIAGRPAPVHAGAEFATVEDVRNAVARAESEMQLKMAAQTLALVADQDRRLAAQSREIDESWVRRQEPTNSLLRTSLSGRTGQE
jgi:hypothetical protein